ncbi:ead/Ea22-like family protein [Serratia marcescens]|nr:ead/Ea22-like family protein [Serratia marcescens]
MDKFSELKAAAMAATPGPWFVHEKPCEDGNYGIDTSDNEWTAEAVVWWGFARQSIWKEEDARFIAAANPAVVLAMLAELEAKDQAHRVHAARLISERGVLRERVTELEAIATDYADKFQKAQDAAKHLIIMNDKDKKRITELDRSETQLIDERDSAHAALDDMYEAITGKRPEWSNWFGFADAIEEVALIAAGFTVEGDE